MSIDIGAIRMRAAAALPGAREDLLALCDEVARQRVKLDADAEQIGRLARDLVTTRAARTTARVEVAALPDPWPGTAIAYVDRADVLAILDRISAT